MVDVLNPGDKGDPVRIVTSGSSDPVILDKSGSRRNRVRVVTSGPSNPIRVVEDRRESEPVDPPAETPWYLAGGISSEDCLVAYEAKGSSSLSESYSNLAQEGNNLSSVTPPTWSAESGWSFDGTSQYLITEELELGADTSVILKIKDFTPMGVGFARALFGMQTHEGIQIYFNLEITEMGLNNSNPAGFDVSFYVNNGYTDFETESVADGIYCFTRNESYIDGIPVSNPEYYDPPLDYEVTPVYPITLGAGRAIFEGNILINQFSKVKIEYFALYKRTLTQEEALAVSEAINLI